MLGIFSRFCCHLLTNAFQKLGVIGNYGDHFGLRNQGPELQCLLKVKQDLSKVLIFQHYILNAI